MKTANLSSVTAVLLEIKRIQSLKNTLETIYGFQNFRNVKILFSCTNKIGAEQMIWLTNDMLPFHLPNEIAIILEDAIEDYEKDIQSLNFHLKNL